jgi:hypothetical protein
MDVMDDTSGHWFMGALVAGLTGPFVEIALLGPSYDNHHGAWDSTALGLLLAVAWVTFVVATVWLVDRLRARLGSSPVRHSR